MTQSCPAPVEETTRPLCINQCYSLYFVEGNLEHKSVISYLVLVSTWNEIAPTHRIQRPFSLNSLTKFNYAVRALRRKYMTSKLLLYTPRFTYDLMHFMYDSIHAARACGFSSFGRYEMGPGETGWS